MVTLSLKSPFVRKDFSVRSPHIRVPWLNLITDQVIHNLCTKGIPGFLRGGLGIAFAIPHLNLVEYAFGGHRPEGHEVVQLLAFVEARCPTTCVWHYDDSEYETEKAALEAATHIARMNNKKHVIAVRHHVTRTPSAVQTQTAAVAA